MTKSESRSFGKMLVLKKTDKNYLQLFDYLQDAKTIDFDALEKLYGKHGLEAARKHLAKVLMKAIRDADASNGLDNKLTDLLKDAKILHRKGFNKECFDLINNIKDIALNNEAHEHFLMAARFEIKLLAQMQFAGVNEIELIEKQQTIEHILDHEKHFHRHTSLQEILLTRYWRKGTVNTPQEKIKLNDLLLEENNILKNRSYRSFRAKKAHLNFQSVYFLMTGDHQESLKIFYELNTLFQQNKHLWLDSPEDYIDLLDGILTDLYAVGSFSEMDFFIEQFTQVPSASEDLRFKMEILIIYHRLSVLNQSGNYAAGKQLIKENQLLINKLFKGVPSNLQAQLCFNVSLVLFNNSEFKDCARLLNSILNMLDNNVSNDTQNHLRTLYIIAQYELQNYDYLPYQIRSFQRKLNTKPGGEIEHIVINIIKHLSMGHTFDTAFYRQNLDKISELETSPQHRYIIQKLQIKQWMKRHQKNIKPQ